MILSLLRLWNESLRVVMEEKLFDKQGFKMVALEFVFVSIRLKCCVEIVVFGSAKGRKVSENDASKIKIARFCVSRRHFEADSCESSGLHFRRNWMRKVDANSAVFAGIDADVRFGERNAHCLHSTSPHQCSEHRRQSCGRNGGRSGRNRRIQVSSKRRNSFVWLVFLFLHRLSSFDWRCFCVTDSIGRVRLVVLFLHRLSCFDWRCFCVVLLIQLEEFDWILAFLVGRS
jgi:hypothetical protein